MRNIFCEKCGVLKPMHPEDVMMGFVRRRTVITAKKPAEHKIETYEDGQLSNTEHLSSLVCYGCGVPIKDGDQAVAVSMWRGELGEMEFWEAEYMENQHFGGD